MHQERQLVWQQIVAQTSKEYSVLPPAEKDWIETQLRRLEELQLRLNQLFETADGSQACGACQGDCCAKGHNHMTLANLLGFLQQGDAPPVADFSLTCPFLGGRGCMLVVERRPYNCISFVCDIIEKPLTSADVAGFYRLEKQLRVIYQAFADRYRGGSLTGLLLQHDRLNGHGFLQRKTDVAGE